MAAAAGDLPGTLAALLRIANRAELTAFALSALAWQRPRAAAEYLPVLDHLLALLQATPR